jgi:hypothetical protein
MIYTLHVYMTYFIICICQPYSSVLEVHVKWFLKELLVSLIMPLLSSKSVDEKINPFFKKLAVVYISYITFIFQKHSYK